jgi:hypothetical protein
MTRRTLIQRSGIAAAALYLLEPASLARPAVPGWSDEQYWAFADRMQALMEPRWVPGHRGYRPLSASGETSVNANLLYTHAAAAGAGHTGPSRQDERARSLVDRLCATPPWRAILPGSDEGCPSAQTPEAHAAGDQTHACGWGFALDSTELQHVVIDTAVVRALARAYFARGPLGLSDATVALIRDRIRKAANSTFYAYPSLRLNQINWPLEIYAHADAVLGSQHLLKHDCRLQLSRFADALTHPAAHMRAPNTGPGYRFHYFPQFDASQHTNVDSAEYATIVCGALLFYGQARNAGMAELSHGQLARVRAWVARVLCGYWTHGGYLNWDTGLGFARWHQIKKPPLCQQSLLAIALSPRFQPGPSYGRWARYFFDRGLELFDRITVNGSVPPPPVMFDVQATQSTAGDADLAVARMQANAAQACVYGLGQVPAEEPPPLYAYDPDIGRLTVTTPVYNTAVIAVSQGSFPYGGVELARFFDRDQRIAANIGGVAPSSFGVVVHDRRTGHDTASQRARLRPDLAHPPVRLVTAPRGATAHPIAYPMQAYAGPFKRLEAVGSTTGPGVTIHSRHRFQRDFVQSWWRVQPDGGARPHHDVRVLFPSTGSDVVVTVALRGGGETTLSPSGTIALDAVRWVHLGGTECGYLVVLRSPGLPGRARLSHPAPQSSAPHAGPSLVLEPLRDGTLRDITVSARIAPARTLDDARRLAASLGALR